MKVLIAIIAYNEERAISGVIQDLRTLPTKDHHLWKRMDMVVFDDCSSDSTGKLSNDLGVEVIKHSFQSGNGMFMVSTYLKYAKDCDYDVVIQFDGDGQHLACYIPEICKALIVNKVDVAIGSRFLGDNNPRSLSVCNLDRRAGGKLMSYALQALCDFRIIDPTSGLKAYNRRAIELLADSSISCEDSFSLLVLMRQLGLLVCEVPVVMMERMTGKSEFTLYRKIASSISLLLSLFQVVVKAR